MRKFWLPNLILALAMSACGGGSASIDPIVDLPSFPPRGDLLFINDQGQPRTLNVDYSGQVPEGTIAPFLPEIKVNEGIFQSLAFVGYNGIDDQRTATFDWAPYADDQSTSFAAALREETGIVDHKFTNFYQVVGLDDANVRFDLFFYSQFREREDTVANFNHWIGARAVKFIDVNQFLVFFSDFVGQEPGLTRPQNLSRLGFTQYLFRYDFSKPNRSMGEIIASFGSDLLSNAEVYVSGKRNFYYVYSPNFETTGVSPFVIKANGSGFAYTPFIKGNQLHRRAPGNEAFAIDVHPTLDSLFIASDNRFGTMILRIPPTKEDVFETVAQTPNSSFSQGANPAEAFKEKNWHVRFSPSGNEVAVAQYLSGAPAPTFSIWRWQTNQVRTWSMPQVDGLNFNKIGKPGWDFDSPGQRFVFFTIEDTQSNRAFFAYVDIEGTEPTATILPWEIIKFEDEQVFPPEEVLTRGSEIVQRRLPLETIQITETEN